MYYWNSTIMLQNCRIASGVYPNGMCQDLSSIRDKFRIVYSKIYLKPQFSLALARSTLSREVFVPVRRGSQRYVRGLTFSQKGKQMRVIKGLPRPAQLARMSCMTIRGISRISNPSISSMQSVAYCTTESRRCVYF